MGMIAAFMARMAAFLDASDGRPFIYSVLRRRTMLLLDQKRVYRMSLHFVSQSPPKSR